MKTIIILLLVLSILFIVNINEKFIDFDTSEWFRRNNIPESIWWNSTRRTRNMSYDLRGDPVILSQKEYIGNNNYII